MSDFTIWVLFLLLCAAVLDAIPPPKKKGPARQR
jgi:hypothetical protein